MKIESKAGLYKTLVDSAYDEASRLMQEAVKRADGLEAQLEEILTAIFEFSRERHALSRLAFATAFAASQELPDELRCREKGERNFAFVAGLIQQGIANGKLDGSFDAQTLSFGIYGALSFYIMADVLAPGSPVCREVAKEIVRLFMKGAEAK